MPFECTVNTIILVNCVFMFFAANHEVHRWNTEPDPWILIGDIFFQMCYTCEMVLKLSVHRAFFFWNDHAGLNTFDFALVILGFVDLIATASGGSIVWMRLLRLAKLGKALRAVRLILGCEKLRAILICIHGSFMSLVWSIVMLAIVFYMFSLFFVQNAALYFQEYGEQNELMDMYGSVQKAMLTLYQACSGGEDWSRSFTVISMTGAMSTVLFLFFITFSNIALLNIITGIFVDSAMQNLAPDRETMAKRHHEDLVMDSKELERLSHQVDSDASGRLSKEQFEDLLRIGRIPLFLQMLGLDMRHVRAFFDALAENE